MSSSRRFALMHPDEPGMRLHRKAPERPMAVAAGWIGYALIVWAVFVTIFLLL